MSDLYGIIGLGRFGRSLAYRLVELNKNVICIDNDEDKVKEVSEFIDNVYQANCLDEKALKEVGISDVDIAVVSIGEDIETSVMSVAILHSLGIDNIYAKAVTPLHGRILAKVGAKRVIFPEKEMGVSLANTLAGMDIIQTLTKGKSYVVAKIEAPKGFHNKTILEIDVRNQYGLNIIGIERGNELNINPHAKETIHKNDELLVVGKREDIERIIK